MIPCIESGIPGFDELTRTETGTGGIPENSSTLIYGPPKTGKTLFCNQFAYKGLFIQEPCLYITTDLGIKHLESKMLEFLLPIEKFIDDNSLYVIDTVTDVSNGLPIESETITFSHVNNPTDIMVKVGSAVYYIQKENMRFRSVLDSTVNLLGYNDYMLIIRVLKAYLMRTNEFGGTPIITYTQDSVDKRVETMLKSLVDNIIRLDGNNLTVEAMKGIGKRSSPYQITTKGIELSTDF